MGRTAQSRHAVEKERSRPAFPPDWTLTYAPASPYMRSSFSIRVTPVLRFLLPKAARGLCSRMLKCYVALQMQTLECDP